MTTDDVLKHLERDQEERAVWLAIVRETEAKLERLREENESLDADVLLRDEHIKDLRTERDEAVAALRATPHVGGKPGQTHRSHPNPLSCHACAFLARLTTPDWAKPDPSLGERRELTREQAMGHIEGESAYD